MKLTELKPGDWVKINDGDIEREGVIIRISHEEHEACIDNGVQEFWYSLDNVSGLPLDDNQLLKLGFTKLQTNEGVKYGKDAFRIRIPAEGNFSRSEVWYREDHSVFNRPLMVHELQNIHLQMTKMSLEA